MTEEQRERLKQIRERLATHRVEVDKYRSLKWAEGDALRYYKAPDDVDFLLSLLDSHAVGCNAADWAIERVQSEYLRGRSEATTSMRSRCVKKMRAKAGSYQKDSERPDFLPNYKKQMAFAASALREAATELESLPLGQMEQERR